MYENKPITGSYVVDLVNDMLRHRKGFEPERSGTNECTRKYCVQPPETKRHPGIES